MFKIVCVDTDSVKFTKLDGSPFTEDEHDTFYAGFSAQFPPLIKWDDDGEYSTFIVAKAKNYYCVDMKGKITKKGSAFKSSKMEAALKEFQQSVLDAIVAGRQCDAQEIYHRYVKEIYHASDITRWSSKKTMTQKVIDSKRKNEKTIRDAAKGRYSVGDKFWVYYTADGSLRDVADFEQGTQDTKRLMKKLFMSSRIFNTFLPVEFINYTLAKNVSKLRLLLGESAKVDKKSIKEVVKFTDMFFKRGKRHVKKPITNRNDHDNVGVRLQADDKQTEQTTVRRRSRPKIQK